MKYTYEEYINLIKTMKFDNNEFSQFLLELENVCNKRDDYHLEEYIKYSVIIGKFSQYNDITPYFNRIIQLMNIFLNIAQDDFEKSNVYYSLVLVYFKSTFLPKPIEYSLKYLELNVGDDMHKMHIYNFLSIMLKQVGFYEQSFEYGMKFYEISKTIKGFDNIMLDIISYNNFCYILLDMNKYEEAMKYVDLLKEMFKNNPDNPTVKENITQTKFTFLYVKLFSNDLKINDEAISEYINIMETLINTPLHDFNKRETVETHLKFLKAMIAKGKQEEALKIALHILYDRNFFGDHISLYKLIFTILDNNKLVTDERYNELLKEFNHELLEYQTQQQDILMLLVSEQFRINQINKEYNNIKEKYEKDFLTNCYNRPSLEMNGQNFINEKINGSIVFIDLDSLKSINRNMDT